MSLDFDTSPGGLLVRIGAIGHVLYQLSGVQASLGSYSGLAAQYLASVTPNLHSDYAPFEVQSDGILRAIPPGPMSALQQLAVRTLLGQVAADVPSAGRSVPAALAEVYRQMVAQTKTVKRSVTAVTATGFSSPANTGNGAVAVTATRADGLPQEHLIAESARLSCTADSYTGGQTAGRESFVFSGKQNLAQPWDYDYPQGSGAATSLQAVDAAQDATSNGNLLTNSNMENWAGSPLGLSNWATSGTWGTDVIRTATPFGGAFAAQFAATAVNAAIRQTFNDSTGTTTNPDLLRVYAVSLWMRRVSTALGAGVLTVSFVDASDTVILDAQGNPASFTLNLTTLTTGYVNFSGTLRLPAVRPTAVKFQLRVSTNNDNPFLVDRVAMTPVTVPYPGGPGIAVFSGSTPFKLADGWTIATTNSRGGASYGATFQQLFDRLFGTRGMGFQLPSDASPSESDTLITA